ncbi:tRNA (N6-isopentenyl adenosine(37)-C2)-methylthiotransferase MiaB [Candidatus Marinamargulisbacteria bacterium SCGC AAA071-K20]|nr:tRNA (N6-isopentenyl adenosine(37)-C2)-methylthiotransferase MiaB [Candidatus Marinamargulisbacteria bacterium SCGC AAA071-K20]
MKEKVFIETYGCQMNVYDTELVKSILTKHKFSIVDKEEQAEIVMLNTCSVRDNANRKIYNRVHEIKKQNQNALIGVLGCMATNFKKDLLDNTKLKIDFIAGPDSYKQLPTLIEDLRETNEKTYDINLSEFETYSDVYPVREKGVNAWIAVMRGCNNFCTFCVVPYTRGRERSRDPLNVVEEVKRLVSEGYKQVTLLGQNVNSYKFEDFDFADLIKMVSDVEGVERIRYTSPHPKDYPTKLLKVMAERDNVCKQLHMPLQAGNDRVLHKMNRTYTKQEFLDLIAHAREIIPNVKISTDIIVGFPTETQEEFEDTVEVMNKVKFDQAFIFKYSERPNTRAAQKFPDDVSEPDKTKRIVECVELQKEHSLESNQSEIGKTHMLLIEEEFSKKNPELAVGRTDCNKVVSFLRNNNKVGDLVPVKITQASPHGLRGLL